MKYSRLLEEWLFPLITVLQGILVFFQILDIFKPTYYPTINRITRSLNFQIRQSLVLPLILLICISIIYATLKQKQKIGFIPLISILIYPYYGIETTLVVASLSSLILAFYTVREPEKYLLLTFLIISTINFLSILHWAIFYPLNIKTTLESIAFFQRDIYYLLLYFAPLITLPLFFTVLVKIIFIWFSDPPKGRKITISQKKSKKIIYCMVFLVVLLSIISAIYPYLPNINPDDINVGVDITNYVKMAKIVDHDITQAFNVSAGAKPMVYMTIIIFKRLFGLTYVSAVRYLPVILNPIFTLSIFFLSYELFQNSWIATWSAFFTVCGYQITINMYSYFLANILGLSLVFISLGFLFRSIRKKEVKSLVAASIPGFLLVYTHPWTYNQYYFTMVILTVVTFNYFRKERELLTRFILYLIILAAAELIKSQLFKGYGSMTATSEVLNRVINLGNFWLSSIYSFQFLYGGFLSNIILLLLATFGAYIISLQDVRERFLNILLTLTGLVFLIGDEIIKSRLLFNIPIGILAALGFLSINCRFKNQTIKDSFTFFTVTSMLVYLFQSLANLI